MSTILLASKVDENFICKQRLTITTAINIITWVQHNDLPSSLFLFVVCREMRLVSDSYTERFDPIIISPVPITALQSWGRKDDLNFKPTDYSSLEVARHRVSPFPVSDSINNRFIIW